MKWLRVSIILVVIMIASVANCQALYDWQLEEFGKALQNEGYQLRPISGWDKLVGDTYIVQLNCVNNNGDHVLVEIMKIGNKHITKMYPPQQRVTKNARKVNLAVSVKYTKNIIIINIKNIYGRSNDEIPISIIVLDQAITELSSKKQELKLVLYGNKTNEFNLPKEFYAKKGELEIISFTLLCTYAEHRIFHKSFFITPYNGKINIQSVDFLKKNDRKSNTPIKDRGWQFAIVGGFKSIGISIRDKNGATSDTVKVSIIITVPGGKKYKTQRKTKGSEFTEIHFPKDFNVPIEELKPGTYIMQCYHEGKVLFGCTFPVSLNEDGQLDVDQRHVKPLSNE